MGESEKISVLSKRKLFCFPPPLPLLELYDYIFLLEGGIATQANISQYQPGLKVRLIFPVRFSSFPSLGPGEQVGNVAFPQSCTELPN